MSDDPSDNPELDAWLEGLANQCRCRPTWLRPCEGLQTGGLCDDLDLTETESEEEP